MSPADRSISAVLHDIVGNIQDIVRCEIRMAKTELTEEVGKSRSAGMLVGIGALMLAFSALFLLLAAVFALSLLVPEWAAALIVGAASAQLRRCVSAPESKGSRQCVRHRKLSPA